MVKKLLKYEFISYFRMLMPIQVILLGISLLTRLLQLFENDSFGYSLLFGTAVAAQAVASVAALVLTIAIVVVRYYKNLFTTEGYLTFTLPVTQSQILFSKLLVAMVAYISTWAAIIVSLCIATMGDVLAEILKAVMYLYGQLLQLTGVHAVFYLLEIIVLSLLSIATQFLLFYVCITLGQTMRKLRILAAFGIYFAYYYVCQILATILMVVLVSTADLLPLQTLQQFLYTYPNGTVHSLLCMSMAITFAVATAYWVICRVVLRKKINLE